MTVVIMLDKIISSNLISWIIASFKREKDLLLVNYTISKRWWI